MVGWKVSVRQMTVVRLTVVILKIVSQATTTTAVKMSLKKLNLPNFKCYRVYLELLDLQKLSNVDDFSWRYILKDFIQVQKEKREFVIVCSLSL